MWDNAPYCFIHLFWISCYSVDSYFCSFPVICSTKLYVSKMCLLYALVFILFHFACLWPLMSLCMCVYKWDLCIFYVSFCFLLHIYRTGYLYWTSCKNVFLVSFSDMWCHVWLLHATTVDRKWCQGFNSSKQSPFLSISADLRCCWV